MAKEKMSAIEKIELRKEKKGWTDFIRRMKEKGALVNQQTEPEEKTNLSLIEK